MKECIGKEIFMNIGQTVSFGGNLIINNAKVHLIAGKTEHEAEAHSEIGNFYDFTKGLNEPDGNSYSFSIPTEKIKKIYQGKDKNYYIYFNANKKNNDKRGDSMISFRPNGFTNPLIAYTAACQNPNVNIVV